MNEIIKAMEERRSIRKFKPDMPTKEDMEVCPKKYVFYSFSKRGCDGPFHPFLIKYLT